MAFTDRLKHAWNAFMNKDPTPTSYYRYGMVSSIKPDRVRRSITSERTIIMSIMNRIALDVSNVSIKHVHTDDKGRYDKDMMSGLNSCLTINANLDQTSRNFIKDVVMSMFDEGVVAIVPTVASENVKTTESYDIYELRTGKIVEWYPRNVKVRVYNEDIGSREDIILPKRCVAIVENPFYEVMNEPNSTLKRLLRKLTLIDAVDEQSGSGKLDLIIQLPYTIKSEARRIQAEERKKDIEMQLAGSKYGIEYLTSMLYSQLGITSSIMDGTADEKTMLNYENRTLVPILSAIVDAMTYKFLTKTAYTKGQRIMYFRDPFKLVPVSEIATIADTFTRNEIMSTNELRQVIGMMPVKDPRADELRNKNLNPGAEQTFASTKENVNTVEENQNG